MFFAPQLPCSPTKKMCACRCTEMRATGSLTSTVSGDRPDSFSDLVYSLQQAVSSQMGAGSSKDLRSSSVQAAAAAAVASSVGQAQTSHRQKKFSRVRNVDIVGSFSWMSPRSRSSRRMRQWGLGKAMGRHLTHLVWLPHWYYLLLRFGAYV